MITTRYYNMKGFIILGVFVLLLISGGVYAADNSSNAVNKTRNDSSVVEKRTIGRVDFVPWQKRNDSECLEGCKCAGAVVSCETEDGKIMTITAGRSGKELIITIGKTNVTTELELEQETENNKSILRAKLSNGRKAEIKTMPDTASERALERLRLKVCSTDNNCTIVLKEVGSGEDKKVSYEVQIERHSRILGIFQKKMQVRADVDAETGEVSTHKPWWAFLAREPEE